VVKHLFPKADIPVVQMSLDYSRPAHYHYELAKELSPFRRKGILILGSGNIVHNLGTVAWDKLNAEEYGYNWAIEANEKMKKLIRDDNHRSLIDYQTQGEAFNLAVPTPDHYLPLLYVLALKEKNDSLHFFNDKIVAGSLSMTSLKL
jgi:4,5-DOPA dioxygenase extradiol